MKMMKPTTKQIKYSLLLICLAMLIGAVLVPASAISTGSAKEPIDVTRTCNLTLGYRREEAVFPDLEVRVWKISTVTADMQYARTGAFAAYPIEYNRITTQDEWKSMTTTVDYYIDADRITPNMIGTTGEDGTILFSGLEPGLYFVKGITVETKEGSVTFQPTIVALPGLNEDGYWEYEVTAYPKPAATPLPSGGPYTYAVTKLWRDYGEDENRPHEICVEIYRDNESYQYIVLKPSDNWTYTWTSDEYYEWRVVERDFTGDYTVTIDFQEGEVVGAGDYNVTNSIPNEEPPAPPTGDTVDLKLYTVILFAAGVLLVLTACIGRKKEA